jgi:aspartyl-tRNA synthetase
MDAEERALAYMLKYIKKAHGKEIMAHYGRDISIPKLPFPKISFSEAKAVLSARGVVEEKPTDLSSEEEKELSKYILETTNSEFVFVYDYPYKGRAFYSMRYDENPELCKGFDLLWNGLEITSGAQREHRYNKLLENIQEKEINLEHIKTYADFFKYGCPPHGGYGLSPSRLLMKLFNVGNVREVTYVYRGINRLDP